MKILFTGGGTAGHLMPIIAIARELKRLQPPEDLSLYYLGPKDAFNALLLSQEGFTPHAIAAGKIRRYFSLKNITDIVFKIPFGFLQSLYFLIAIRPRLVFSKGGSGSLVAVIAAWILQIPIFIHESDSFPGLSNRVTSRWAKKVFVSFPKTAYVDLATAILTGNPVKKELQEGSEDSAKELFNLRSGKPVVLFLGGSQGAQAINEFLLPALNDLMKDYEVIHACGKKHYENVMKEARIMPDQNLQAYYHAYGFLDEVHMKHAYKIASVVVSRAGSGSIFEIAACGKPSILIPLPSSAGDHQSKNAYEYAATGAAVVIEQENLTPNLFIGMINSIVLQPEKMALMQKAALNFAKPLAAKAIAREILEYLG